jgi:predicted protein tyrosine phosphatase
MIVMGNLAMIFVCNLHEMPNHVGVLRPSHLVSLVTSAEQPPMPDSILIQRHLRIEIDDTTESTPGAVLPERHHLENMIEFIRVWKHDDDPLLIHSVAGISRSMASAFIAWCSRRADAKSRPRSAFARQGPRRKSAEATSRRRWLAPVW